MTSLSDTPRLQYYDVQTLEYRYISKLPMKNERIWSYVKETTSNLQNKLTKNIHLGVATRSSTKWDCLKTNTVSSVYMRIITFPNFFTRGYRSQIFDRNHIPSHTSAGSVLQLCKVSFKSNEQLSRSCACKVHAPPPPPPPSPLFS